MSLFRDRTVGAGRDADARDEVAGSFLLESGLDARAVVDCELATIAETASARQAGERRHGARDGS
jgi:hypothetical protein